MFIAEIGINHNGDISLAKKLIQMAKKAGADVVKFQKRDIETCIPLSMRDIIKQTPWGEMTYIDYKKKLEFSKDDYCVIDVYCKEIGIKWAASVWDINSLEFIYSFDVPFIKIPSACITDNELLLEAKASKKPLIISTGMSSLDEIMKAVELLSGCDLTILHCNSSYPAEDNELDLNVIRLYKKIFPQYRIGYSGHERNIYACVIAKVIGAEVIERHITLDKNMWGTDQGASLTEDELSTLIEALKNTQTWLGKSEVQVYDSEIKVRNKLRRI